MVFPTRYVLLPLSSFLGLLPKIHRRQSVTTSPGEMIQHIYVQTEVFVSANNRRHGNFRLLKCKILLPSVEIARRNLFSRIPTTIVWWPVSPKGVLTFTPLNPGAVNLIKGPPRPHRFFWPTPSPSVKPNPSRSLTRTPGAQTWIGAALFTQNGSLPNKDPKRKPKSSSGFETSHKYNCSNCSSPA